jgi:hypothetical protein
MTWLAAKDLTIPNEGESIGYQRDAIPSHVAKIAANFDWRWFGVLDVVKRTDLTGGRLQVADGGNRLRAVNMRGDIPEVPCIIHVANNVEEAASIFLGINVNRQNIAFEPLHKAKLIAKDETHMLAQSAWDKLNSKGKIFESKKSLVKFCKTPEAHAALTRMIPVLRDLALASKKRRVSADFLKGLITLEIAMQPGSSLGGLKYIKKMKSMDMDHLADFSTAPTGRHPNKFAAILAHRLKVRPNPYPNKG